MVSDRRSEHARRRRRRRLQRRLAWGAVAVVLVVGLAALILQPPAFLTASSDATPSPSPRALPPPTSASPTPDPTSTPTLGSVTDVKNELQARIAITGDTGMRNAAVRRTASSMEAEAERTNEPYDAMVILGDMIYPDGEAALTEESVTQPFAGVLDEAELIPVLGNHDVQSGEGMQIMRRLGRTTPYYVDQIGPVRLVALDSNSISARQTAWLRQQLAADQKRGTWTIPLMHHAPYSAGDHGNDERVINRWVPLFEQAGVEIVFAGHDHDYQRSRPIDNVTYIVSGGGAKLRAAGRKDFTAFSRSVFHYVDLLVYEDRLEGRAIGHDGDVIDTFTIER